LSVAIAYSCNDFSFIATDTLITYRNGFQEDSYDKIMQIYQHGMGFIAGTGFFDIIEAAYDYLKKASENDIDASIKDVYRISYTDNPNRSSDAFANILISYVTKNVPEIIFLMSNGGYGMIGHNRFFILPPLDISEENFPPDINDSLEYNYNGDFHGFLIKIGELFSHFSENSLYVSSTIKCGLHYYFDDKSDNERRREWSCPHVSNMIENARTKAYIVMAYEVNNHRHYKG